MLELVTDELHRIRNSSSESSSSTKYLTHVHSSGQQGLEQEQSSSVGNVDSPSSPPSKKRGALAEQVRRALSKDNLLLLSYVGKKDYRSEDGLHPQVGSGSLPNADSSVFAGSVLSKLDMSVVAGSSNQLDNMREVCFFSLEDHVLTEPSGIVLCQLM